MQKVNLTASSLLAMEAAQAHLKLIFGRNISSWRDVNLSIHDPSDDGEIKFRGIELEIKARIYQKNLPIKITVTLHSDLNNEVTYWWVYGVLIEIAEMACDICLDESEVFVRWMSFSPAAGKKQILHKAETSDSASQHAESRAYERAHNEFIAGLLKAAA